MKATTKIVIVGTLALASAFVMHKLYDYRKQGHIQKVVHESVEATQQADPEAFKAYTNWARKTVERYSTVQPMKPPEPETIRITFNPKGTNEIRMIQKMTETLRDLGIERDEATVSKLVLARVKADWNNKPTNGLWDKPDWARIQSIALQRKISYLLPSGTNADGQLIPADPLTVQRVMECNIGPTVPPVQEPEPEEEIVKYLP